MTAPWTSEDNAASQEVLLAALQEYEVDAEQPKGPLDALWVIGEVQARYAQHREALVAATDSDEGRAELRRADEAFLRTVEEIDRVRPRGVFEATVSHVVAGFNRAVEGLITARFNEFFAGLGDLFIRTPIGAFRQDWMFGLAYGALFVVVVALGGGAISRMAATELAHGEKLRLNEGLDFAMANWQRLIFALVLPLLIAAMLATLLLLAGFFLMLPWIDVIGGILYGVALVIGFLVVFLLAGYAAGFSLLLPAVACENCDAADAQQRAYAYVLSRPLHLLGYGFVGSVSLAVGFAIASLFSVAALNVTGALMDVTTANAAVEVNYGFATFDLSPRRETALPMAMHSRWAAGLVMLWQTVVVCLVAGYVFSHYFTASTTVYMLMRRVCDGQEMDEIWEPGVVPGAAPGDAAELDGDGEAEPAREEDEER